MGHYYYYYYHHHRRRRRRRHLLHAFLKQAVSLGNTLLQLFCCY